MFEPLDIRTPENYVHFAGEHASLKHGWIEGAVESGIRVTKGIVTTAVA
jgi:monoamine oxidase